MGYYLLLGSARHFVYNMATPFNLTEPHISRDKQTNSKRLTNTKPGNQVGEPVFCLPSRVSPFSIMAMLPQTNSKPASNLQDSSLLKIVFLPFQQKSERG